MKKLTTKILICGMILAGLCQVQALELRLSTDNGASWTNIVDNGPADSNPALGLISYTGTIDGFTVGADSGDNVTGDLSNPYLDLSTVNFSQQPASLIVQLSDTSFTPFNNQTFIASVFGRTTGTSFFNAYRDTNNVLFGETQTLFSEGPFSGVNYSSSNAVAVATGGNAPYSLTLETTIIHTGAGDTETDSSIYTLPPPPCNCAVTFTSPSMITNCAGDTIPGATATQDCGSGPIPVTVTVIGAVTNGTCPQIITRTNSAVDACGTAHTQFQTITVNCAPICTITPSVTTTTVGTSNLTASVANAGPGATYAWSVINGTITAGQGTTKITFTAGTDTSNPISISIKIINQSGCQNDCSASIRNTPNAPACTITGVTISDTSWNKFNVPNGTTPSVWVHAHIGGVKGVPTTGITTIQFVNVSISLNGTSYTMPDGVMIFDSSAPATPTTTFSGGKWITTFNPSKLSDEMFFTGAAIPVSASVAAGAKATLTYTTQASVQGLSFNWQWSAAVFTFWPTDWNQAMIQPYHQGDHAGTPENTTVQKSLIQGPRGGGGSNFTGSWSATGNAACQ